MKTCPVCAATCFDDMDVCFGCMHRFGGDGTVNVAEQNAQARTVPLGGDASGAPSAPGQALAAAPASQSAPLVVESDSTSVSVPMVARVDARPVVRAAGQPDNAGSNGAVAASRAGQHAALHAEYRLMLSVVPVGDQTAGVPAGVR